MVSAASNLIIVCLILSVLAKSVESVKKYHTKIALATQGKASEMDVWLQFYSYMKFKPRVVLFLMSYDKPINENYCKGDVVCVFAPKSTWTSGRNILARKIAHYQKAHQQHFKYWLFADQDMAWLKSCMAEDCSINNQRGKSYTPYSMNLAACCFDATMDMLLSREVQYAVVSFVNWEKERLSADYPSFAHWDCNDGPLNAIHHAAVPVLLPYVELVEKLSWWESLEAQQSVIVACLRGYSVYSNLISIKLGTTDHADYPRGRFPLDLSKALHHVYGSRNLTHVSQSEVAPGANCVGHDHEKMGLVGAFEPRVEGRPGKLPLKTLWNSSVWLDSERYRVCLRALLPRYHRFLETGDMTAVDGEQYTVSLGNSSSSAVV